MAEHLSRSRWAERKIGQSWLVAGVGGGVATAIVAYFAGMTDELAAIAVGLGGGVLITALR
jgi:hypothetical protein